jgi:DNA-binding LacI/PurR family transcriptional regulator
MSKNVTLKDVASKAGVSYQTVSKVLRNQKQVTPEVRERIYAAVNELGYRVNIAAQNLRTQSSKLIAYSWAPWGRNFFHPILELFQQGIVEEAAELGYHILLFPQRPDSDPAETYRDLVLTGRVDGFILSSIEFNDPRIPVLQELDVPLVAFGSTNSPQPHPYVDVDNAAGLYAAVEHLLAQGHHRIAALAWPEDSRVGEQRLAGYLTAMQEAGIPIHPEWIVRGSSDPEFGYAGGSQLLDLPADVRPTAIVTMLDVIAIGAVRAAEARAMQVGRDVAIVGFDDMPVTEYFKPALTTVRQPVWSVGQQTVRMLVQLLEGEPLEQQGVLMKPELIIRESTQGFDPSRGQ